MRAPLRLRAKNKRRCSVPAADSTAQPSSPRREAVGNAMAVPQEGLQPHSSPQLPTTTYGGRERSHSHPMMTIFRTLHQGCSCRIHGNRPPQWVPHPRKRHPPLPTPPPTRGHHRCCHPTAPMLCPGEVCGGSQSRAHVCSVTAGCCGHAANILAVQTPTLVSHQH